MYMYIIVYTCIYWFMVIHPTMGIYIYIISRNERIGRCQASVVQATILDEPGL